MQEFIMNNQWIILPIVAWTLFWKGWALWRSARAGQKVWYAFLLILNTLGILEIVYIIITSKPKAKPAMPVGTAPLQQ